MSQASVIIFAGSYSQAIQYAKEHGLTPSEYIIADSAQRLAGLDRKQLSEIRIGTWYENPDVCDAWEYWETRRLSSAGAKL